MTPRNRNLTCRFIDLAAGPTWAGDSYHKRLAGLREQGWLASSPLAFHRPRPRGRGSSSSAPRAAAFPGREIADLFGITRRGPLREHIDANILNQQGRPSPAAPGPWSDRRSPPRAADRWRPAMRGLPGPAVGAAWSRRPSCEFVAALAKPYPSLTIGPPCSGAPDRDAPRPARVVQPGAAAVRHHGNSPARCPRSRPAVVEGPGITSRGCCSGGRADPGDDLITALLAAERPRRPAFPHAECVNLVLERHRRGHRHHPGPSCRTRCGCSPRIPRPVGNSCASSPALTPRAVEEVLRAEPDHARSPRGSAPGTWKHRGVTFPAGTIVAICAERANREQGRRRGLRHRSPNATGGC